MKFLARTAAATAGIAVLVPVLVMVPGRAFASTIPFTLALLDTRTPDSDELDVPSVIQNTGNPPAAATNTNIGAVTDWGSTSVTASANLATGVLEAGASATFTGSSGSVYAQSNAAIGDGFRTTNTNGQPFDSITEGTAQFTLTLDGSLTSSFPTLQDTTGGGFVLLQLYQADSLSTANAFGPQAGAYYLFLLGNPDQNLESCGTSGCETLIPTATYTDLSLTDPITITQTIPLPIDGNFDWTVLLGVQGTLTDPGSFDFNLAHTVTVGYQGPVGTTTTSVSGEFQNFDSTSPVPEPGTLVLLGSGALGLFARRRRRNAN